MNPVKQEEKWGCGIATVATLADKSYKEVQATANKLGIFADDPKLFSDTNYVRRLLKEYGVSVATREEPFSTWDKLPDLALLATKYHVEDGQALWHWVVFRREGKTETVLDSAVHLENNVRTDLNQIQPKWFIEIAGLS